MDSNQIVNEEKSIKLRLRNCIDIVRKTLNVGIDASVELSKQEEQLERMNNKVVVIDENVKNAHRTLDNMSSYIKSLLGSVKYLVIKKNNIDNANDLNNNSKIDKPNELGTTDNTYNLDEFDKLDKLDELDELYDLTIKMKEVSLEINKALDRQCNKILKITDEVDDVNLDIRSANGKINKLL